MRWRVLRKELFPSAGRLTLFGGAAAVLFVGLAIAAMFVLTADVDDPVGTGTFIMAFTAVPLAILFFLVGTFREKGAAARTVLYLFAGLLLVVAGGMVSLGMSADPDYGFGVGGPFFVLCCAPATLLPFIPAIYYATRALPQLRAALEAERTTLALETIKARGEISFSELAQDLQVPEEQVADLFGAVLEAAPSKGAMYPAHKRIYSTVALSRKQRKLLAVIRARGQIQVDELADELDAPLDLLKEWIYQLVQRDKFTGYINWDEGMLYSKEAEQLRKTGRCPQCSGELSLVGKGVIRCQYCGAEIFL